MNRQKGKLFALAMGVAGVITLAIGAPSWRELVEGWYIWRLDSGDQITRDFAIEKLGEHGSATSIPHLVKLMGSRGGSSGSSLALGALLRIGNVSNKERGYCLNELDLKGKSKAEITAMLGGPHLTLKADSGYLTASSLGPIPEFDEGLVYCADLEWARVYFKGDRVVLALIEWSDF